MSSNTTNILKSIIPNFILDDHPSFVDFIESYYEWMESQGNAIYEIDQYENNLDVDKTVDQFIEHFKKTYIKSLPENILANKNQLIKYISEYYRARGSEKSFKLLFRILFDKDSDFYYPRVDLLRPSDGKWIQYRNLRITSLGRNGFDFLNKNIISKNTNATAFVENVQRTQEGIFEIYELYLNTNSITGIFQENDIITVIGNDSIIGQITPIPKEIKVLKSGVGYKVNQKLEILGGTGGVAHITNVDEIGGIKSIKILNFGAEYNNTPQIDLSLGGEILEMNQAEVEIPVGGLCVYEGRFKSNDGFLSDLKYLQDGKFYQQFSYQTIIEESLDDYKKILLDVLHPAGFTLFGLFRLQTKIDAKGEIAKLQKNPITILTTELNINNKPNQNLKLQVINTIESERNVLTQPIGPTLNSLERDKFYYKPYENYEYSFTIPTETPGISETINETQNYPATPIKYFENYTVKQFMENKFKKIDITVDSVIVSTP